MNSRTSSTLIVLSALAALAACGSRKKAAYVDLADQINPLLIRVRPTVVALHAIVGNSADATARVIEACKTADEALWLLRNVREDDERIRRDYDSGLLKISEVAAALLDHRPLYCRSPNGDPNRFTMCRDWCLDDWGQLVTAATRLRVAAGKEGVDIVSVAP